MGSRIGSRSICASQRTRCCRGTAQPTPAHDDLGVAFPDARDHPALHSTAQTRCEIHAMAPGIGAPNPALKRPMPTALRPI